MRVTKREHAALVVEEAGSTLVIDPGGFTAPFDVSGLAGIVITHEHPDHWSAEHLTRLRASNPGVPIFGPEGVVQAATDFDVIAARPGDELQAGSFRLRFFGGRHAVIHESIPVVDNVGVLVNETLYYPGDSYAVPEGVAVEVLAAPVGAPWLKIGEAMDFVLSVAPRQAFATHDLTVSSIGLNMGRGRLQWATEQGGGTFTALDPGDTLEI